MNARELLATIEGRGGNVAVARDATGVAKIQISPRGLVTDLLPDLQRFKPALLELLAPSVSVARGADDVLGQRIEGAFNRGFTPDEINEHNRAVFALDSGQAPQETYE